MPAIIVNSGLQEFVNSFDAAASKCRGTLNLAQSIASIEMDSNDAFLETSVPGTDPTDCRAFRFRSASNLRSAITAAMCAEYSAWTLATSVAAWH